MLGAPNPYDEAAYLKSMLRGKDRELRDLRGGATYVALQGAMAEQRRRYEARVSKLEAALARERRRHAREIEGWVSTTEAMLAERDRDVARAVAEASRDASRAARRELSEARRAAREQEARALRAERRAGGLEDEVAGLRAELAERDARIAELEALAAKLTAQVRRDFENSSVPSSMQGPGRKRVPNAREPTGRRPGAQPCHPHHPRRRPEPDRVVDLPVPEAAWGDPDLYLTGDVVAKTVVSARIEVTATEYRADVLRSRATGARAHAPFPGGISDDVTYDASVKALAFMLTSGCGASVAGAARFLREASGGALDLSTGMVWGLSREFSAKSAPERARAVESLMSSPVMHADFTVANVGGEHAQVLVLADGSTCRMYARGRKGREGVAGTPLEGYVGRVVHDHDLVFCNYGTSRQECMRHNVRYLVGSVQNEPHLTWNGRMLRLVREMVHRKAAEGSEGPITAEEAADFRERWREVLDLAEREYEERPPGKYNREGYNLARRLREFEDSQLAFLDHPEVPPDNSRCERLARVFKRRQHAAICFRSMEGLELACDAICVIDNLRGEGRDVFDAVEGIFDRRDLCSIGR